MNQNHFTYVSKLFEVGALIGCVRAWIIS